MNILVESSIELTDAQKKQLVTKLEKSTDRRITVDYQVDPGLIGGLRISTAEKVIDLSIAVKLAQLNEQLTTAL